MADMFPAGGETCLTGQGLQAAHDWSEWKPSPLSSFTGPLAVFYTRKCAGCGSEQTRRGDYVTDVVP
jgi:hypothetical protein